MNYNDGILENKPFNFFKQLMYNIALSICIMLVGVLIAVYCFGFRLYEVLSPSQEPYFSKGDMVVVKAQDSYKPGDIIKFDQTPNKILPTSHRLIAVVEYENKTYYLCHGDNVQNLDGSIANGKWEDDAAMIAADLEEGKNVYQIKQKYGNILQIPTAEQVEGKVINHIDNYGVYFRFIKNHPLLLIALVAGIWCISTSIQNEIDIKKTRRLL